MSKIQSRTLPKDDNMFMGLAWFLASFSPDPTQQSGAVFVRDNNILSCGWNAPPTAIINRTDWSESDNWVLPAEESAISDWCEYKDSTLYITHLPSKHSVLKLIKLGVDNIVFSKKNHIYEDDLKVIDEIAKGAIKIEEFKQSLSWMQDWVLNLKYLNVFKKK